MQIRQFGRLAVRSFHVRCTSDVKRNKKKEFFKSKKKASGGAEIKFKCYSIFFFTNSQSINYEVTSKILGRNVLLIKGKEKIAE